MQRIIFLLATTIAYSISRKTKEIKKYFIGNTGCSVNLFGSTCRFETSYSKNGDVTYYNKCTDNDITYGIICIDLKDKDHSISESGILLTKFMHSLHLPFKIAHNTGVQFHHQTRDNILITDYWQDKNNQDWKVKGYTNGEIISVLYVANINNTAVSKTEAFLDGFRFKTK